MPLPTLPSRRSTPALPASRSDAFLVPHTASAPSRYRDAARRVFGKASSGSKAVARAGAKGRQFLEAKGREDSLGGIFARNVGIGTAAVISGAVDQTELGKRFETATHGMVKLSGAVALAGGVVRAFGYDRKYLGKHITRGNTTLLNARIPISLYHLGERIPGVVSGALGKASTPSTPALAGAAQARPAAAASVAGTSTDMVPGEATIS